jgi:hypothetical protein
MGMALDIVAIDDEAKTVAIYFGKPDRTFGSAMIIGDHNVVPYAPVVADLNRDRKVDVLVGYVENQPTIYFNDGSRHNFNALRFGDNKGTTVWIAIPDRSDAPKVVYFANRERAQRREW